MAENKAPVSEDKSSSKYVTVACKIGVPWIDFEVCEKVTMKENTQTGTRDIIQWVRTGTVARVRGTAYPRGEPPEGFPDKPQFVLGYALTPNVLRETWEAIVGQRTKDPLFTSGMVYAFERIEDIKSKARDYEKQLSGLEPIQRTKDEITDKRLPKSLNAGVSTVQPGTRAAA
jgi:hypothetical protein